MSDKIYQKLYFEAIFNHDLYAPVLEPHPDYCVLQFSDSVPYTSYDDVINNKYIVRGRPAGEDNPSVPYAGEIIAEYENLDELVNKGWRLNS